MFNTVLFNVFLVLIICAIIAKYTGITNRIERMREFLFARNNIYLSVFSNVGSILSLAIILSIYMVGVKNYGLVSVLSILLGILIGYSVLYIAYYKIIKRDGDNRQYLYKTIAGGFEQFDIRLLIKTTAFIQYVICIIVEFTVLMSILKGFFPGENTKALTIALLIAFLCSTYTSVGGYSGILRTDLFQVLMFTFGFFCISYIFRNSIIPSIKATLIIKNFEMMRIQDIITCIALTAAGFSAFPDIWIRNMGTFYRGNARLNSIKLSAIFICLSIIPLTLMSLPILMKTSYFTHEYRIDVTLDSFLGLFISSFSTLNNYPIVTWIVIASFVCIFISTIDTWLIGIMQHIYIEKAKKEINHLIIISPFIISILCVIIAAYIPKTMITAIGLLVFPFLFFNTIILLTVAVPNIKKDLKVTTLLYPLIASVVLNVAIIVYFWEETDILASLTIFWTAVFLYCLFFLDLILKKAIWRNVQWKKFGSFLKKKRLY